MATGKVFSIIAAASLVLLLLASLSPVLGFGPFVISSPSQQQQQKSQSRRCQIPTISTPTTASRSFTIRMMMMTNNDDEESSSSESSNKAAEDHDNSSKTSSSISEATAGGGTIAISSAKSAADAAEQSTPTTTSSSKRNNSKSSPSKTGFSLILLPTLLLKFTIVLIVKFATDVVVYPLLYLYRWGRMGKKRIVRSVARLFGKEGGGKEGGINGGGGVKVNGDSA